MFSEDWGFPSCTKVKSTHQPASSRNRRMHYFSKWLHPQSGILLTTYKATFRSAEVALLSKMNVLCKYIISNSPPYWLTSYLLCFIFDPNRHSKNIKNLTCCCCLICNSFLQHMLSLIVLMAGTSLKHQISETFLIRPLDLQQRVLKLPIDSISWLHIYFSLYSAITWGRKNLIVVIKTFKR